MSNIAKILGKYLINCILLRYLRYQRYNQIFLESVRIYRMLEKVKMQRYCKPFTKSYFDCIFYYRYCCSSYLFYSFEPSISTFFFTNALPTLLTILLVLSANSRSKVSVTMIWSFETWSILISIFFNMFVWIGKIWYIYLGYMFSLALKTKLCSIFCWLI